MTMEIENLFKMKEEYIFVFCKQYQLNLSLNRS